MTYQNRTKEQLQDELETRDMLTKEREISDGKYAMKLTEKIVFGLCALGGTIVLGAILNAFIKTFQ